MNKIAQDANYNRIYKYCLFAPLLTGILAALLIVFWSYLDTIINPSHGSMGGAKAGLIFVWIIVIPSNIICSIFSYTILLNLFKAIRESFILSFCSFFWVVFIIILIGVLLPPARYDGMTLFYWACIPFCIVQFISFIIFRVSILKNNNEDN